MKYALESWQLSQVSQPHGPKIKIRLMVWYDRVEFNVPLDTV